MTPSLFIPTRRTSTRRPGRTWGGLGLLVAGILLAGGSTPVAGQMLDGGEWTLLPDDASVGLLVRTDLDLDRELDRRGIRKAWTAFLLKFLGETIVPIESRWAEARALSSRLAPSVGSYLHAVGDDGESWIQMIRWEDPVALEEGLRTVRARPMGGGRFRVADPGIDLVLAPPWMILGSRECRWLESTADRLGRIDPEAADIFSTGDEEAAPLKIRIRHAQPIGGATQLALHPIDAVDARVEFEGRYDASPLPIRTTQRLDRSPLVELQGRTGFAVYESGIGLLDPLLIDRAATIPALMPDVELRRRFAPRRIVVIDGQSVVIQGVGPIEVPAICVAVPLRDLENSTHDRADLQQRVDRWLERGGMAVRATWDPADRTGSEIMRRDEIRHLDLGPGLLEVANGHPMAMGASLDWTLWVEDSGDSGWMVVGSAPDLVRRVAEGLTRSSTAIASEGSPPVAMQGVASPARLAGQLEDLARVRRRTADASAERDALLLERVSSWMARLDRIRWETARQDAQSIEGRGWIRLAEHSAGDRDVASDPPRAGDGP